MMIRALYPKANLLWGPSALRLLILALFSFYVFSAAALSPGINLTLYSSRDNSKPTSLISIGPDVCLYGGAVIAFTTTRSAETAFVCANGSIPIYKAYSSDNCTGSTFRTVSEANDAWLDESHHFSPQTNLSMIFWCNENAGPKSFESMWKPIPPTSTPPTSSNSDQLARFRLYPNNGCWTDPPTEVSTVAVDTCFTLGNSSRVIFDDYGKCKNRTDPLIAMFPGENCSAPEYGPGPTFGPSYWGAKDKCSDGLFSLFREPIRSLAWWCDGFETNKIPWSPDGPFNETNGKITTYEGDSTCSGSGKEIDMVPDTCYPLFDNGGFKVSKDVATCSNGGAAWWSSYREKECTSHWVEEYNSTFTPKTRCQNVSDSFWAGKRGVAFTCKGIPVQGVFSDKVKRDLGLGIGLGVGLFTVFIMIFCIVARRKWRRTAPVDISRPGLQPSGQPVVYK